MMSFLGGGLRSALQDYNPRGQIGQGDAANTAPASSARSNCGDVVPSYGSPDGKLFRILERETGIEPATNSLED